MRHHSVVVGSAQRYQVFQSAPSYTTTAQMPTHTQHTQHIVRRHIPNGFIQKRYRMALSSAHIRVAARAAHRRIAAHTTIIVRITAVVHRYCIGIMQKGRADVMTNHSYTCTRQTVCTRITPNICISTYALLNWFNFFK